MNPQVLTLGYADKQELPSPASVPIAPSPPSKGNAPTETPMSRSENDDPWEKCYSTVKNYDDDLCNGWRDEVDKLLIFAGLFSSTVTAFVLESYGRLSEEPSDKTNWFLEQLLLQTHNANIGNASTSPLPARPEFRPAAIDIRLNVFWFLSLSLSLATVVLAILCIQWLREYQRAAPLDAKDAISLRQIRYEGLIAWKVPTVLLSLPVLLHLSLILFFAGLLDLLWELNRIVAAFVTLVSGVVLVFISVTTLLPGLQLLLMPKGSVFMAQCPYKSPQAWTFHYLLTWLIKLSLPKRRRLFKKSFRLNRYNFFFENKDWVDFDVAWRKMRKVSRKNLKSEEITDVGKGLVWIEKHLGQSTDVICAIYRCIKALAFRDALHVNSNINSKVKSHLASQEVVNNTVHLSEQGRREIASLLFLEQQTRTFPQLDDGYFKLLVHFLVAQMQEAGLSEMSQSPEDGQSSLVLPLVRLRKFCMHDQPRDLVRDYLGCLKIIARNGLLDTADLQEDVWDLLHEIMLPRSTTKSNKTIQDKELAEDACKVMSAFVCDLLRKAPHQLTPETPLKSPISSSDEAYAESVNVLGKEHVEHTEGPDAGLQVVKRCAQGALQAFHSTRECLGLKSPIIPILYPIESRMDKYGGARAYLDSGDAARWEQMMKTLTAPAEPQNTGMVDPSSQGTDTTPSI